MEHTRPIVKLNTKLDVKFKAKLKQKTEADATYYNPGQDASLLLFGGAGPPKRRAGRKHKRNDNYGGSRENRLRFLKEVVDAVIDAIDDVWVSQHGPMKELTWDGEKALDSRKAKL